MDATVDAPMEEKRRLPILEVVIVVAVMGILSILILLPGMHRQRELASRMHCVSNLHNIGLSLRIYEDRERMYPPYDGVFFLCATYGTKDEPDLAVFKDGPSGGKLPSIVVQGNAVMRCSSCHAATASLKCAMDSAGSFLAALT